MTDTTKHEEFDAAEYRAWYSLGELSKILNTYRLRGTLTHHEREQASQIFMDLLTWEKEVTDSLGFWLREPEAPLIKARLGRISAMQDLLNGVYSDLNRAEQAALKEDQ